VKAADKSLWSIARQHYGNPTAAQVKAIYQANRDVMRSETDLKVGMVLRIP
jgi:nucleoid-associated protein YgaU